MAKDDLAHVFAQIADALERLAKAVERLSDDLNEADEEEENDK